ncbi:6726_t:CDS:2, partial [Cetraspora pellucida]
QIKHATNEATLQIIFNNADSALVTAIHDEFSTTNTFYCMFHIVQNISLNLKNYFKDNYNEFIRDFFEAKAFVLKLFMTEMLSTLQVESYNAKIKRLIFNSNTTILDLAEKLITYIFEDKKTEYILFYVSVPKAALVVTANSILSNVCNDNNVDSNSASNSKSEDVTNKIGLDLKELINSYKHKGKGQPKGTNRIQQANKLPKK